MIKYKVDILKKLSEKGYSSYKLKSEKIFGNATIQNFRDNKVCYGDSLNKLCFLLECQPGDILEYVSTDSEIFNPSATEEIHTIAAFEGDTIITKTKKGDVDEAIRKIKEKQEE